MKYQEMKKLSFASGVIPEGYNGRSSRVDFAWFKGQTYIVAQSGYYPAGIPQSIDTNEAYWLLDNHPTAKNVSGLKEVKKCLL